MADVFVSYARDNQQVAQSIARDLQDAGYSVWWDNQLLPHNRFADVIEREIGAARTAVVIWSEAAVKSQWVRAEAELARGQGKLIQVRIDQSPIPLPFNQFQVADLCSWTGDVKSPEWLKVLASVEHFARARSDDEAPASEPHRSGETPGEIKQPRSSRNRRGLLAGAALATVILLGSAGALLTREKHDPRPVRIAIQPFHAIGASPVLTDFAAGLSASLQNVLTQDQLQTLSPAETKGLGDDDLASRAKALGVGLLFSGSVEMKGDALAVDMRLDDPVQHSTLWTAELSGPVAQSDQLQARVGALTVAVLNCSAQGLAPTVSLTDSALQAFLHACELSETSDHGLAGASAAFAMLGAMRQATRAAPDFAAAHSVLAKHLAFAAWFMPHEDQPALRNEAKGEADRALALNSRDPDAFVTLGLLAPTLDYSQREAAFRKALSIDPAWPHANGFLGNVMSDVGRLREALALYQRAASVNPQSVDWTQQVAAALIRVGETDEADRELSRFAQLWPNNAEIWQFQLKSAIAQKHWGDGLKLLDRADNFTPAVTEQDVARWRDLLITLQSNSGPRREVLRRSLVEMSKDDPAEAMMRLAMIGFSDDAFALAGAISPGAPGAPNSPAFLFAPEAAALRSDRRFIPLAQRFGLVNYWRRTGHWPDFCSGQSLTYSCSTEADALLHPR